LAEPPGIVFDPGRRLRVLIAAAEELLQWGFRVLLARQEWAEECLVASRPARALAIVRSERIDVAVLDAESGLSLTERLLVAAPETKILLIDPDVGISPYLARSAGAVGLVPRSSSADDLMSAVRMAGMGLEVFSPVRPAPEDLSTRERQIIGLIAAGATNAEIGDQLSLSPNTIKQHASALYRKLGARNRPEAVRRAQRLGLIA
jgi:DNA-binding NarL/FixJ family response regulator